MDQEWEERQRASQAEAAAVKCACNILAAGDAHQSSGLVCNLLDTFRDCDSIYHITSVTGIEAQCSGNRVLRERERGKSVGAHAIKKK